MPSALTSVQDLLAPAEWRQLDILSDLHLIASEPATAQTWQNYLEQTQADAVLLLGDVFEVWVGDDAVQTGSFEDWCAQVLRRASAKRPVFFMCGNRDFLVGDSFLHSCDVQRMNDPTCLHFHGQRFLLSHGDALCLGDHDYQKFRQQVRSPAWQEAFLARPLAERRLTARALRDASEQRKREGQRYADADTEMSRQWLQQANATTLIHGHTHQAADHDLGDGLSRWVTSDWDLAAQPARAQVLQLCVDGDQVTHRRLDWR